MNKKQRQNTDPKHPSRPEDPTQSSSSGAPTPPPPPAESKTPDARQARSQRIALEAEVIGKHFFGALLATALKVPNVTISESYIEYLAQLFEDAGNPTDPVEKMQLEQLAMVHFRIGALHAQAAGTNSTEGQRILNGCAARLTGEFRKLSVAVRSIRSSQPKARRNASRLKVAAG